MELTKDNTVIGFIGIGVMGRSMVRHLLKAGYPLFIFNRTKDKAQELIELGAIWCDSVAEVASHCNVIITMVGYPADVQEVYLGINGVINSGQAGTYLIDMTTSSPSLAKKIYAAALARGMFALDAPVSGGDVGAQEAKLSIMGGGEQASFETVKSVLSVLGTNIVHQGGPGAGQYTKMCNQIAISSNMIGVAEAILYAEKAGLNPLTVLKSIETGAAGSWSLSNLAPRMIAGNFAPGFYVKHFIKDIIIALESAKEMGIELPGLELAKSLYDKLAAVGDENCGTQALYKLYY